MLQVIIHKSILKNIIAMFIQPICHQELLQKCYLGLLLGAIHMRCQSIKMETSLNA